ncbi:GNAT family N-acetyltransferase [Marinomonas sp. 5E14-1]|uniref:tRNA(Met) cytidine acetyltransferase TmcA n=1 Tax=Marinomonas sp. 5E14-1 TaxID=3153922 RepID=UPI003265AC48
MYSPDNSTVNSVDQHRHCFLLKGSTHEVLSDFLHLSEALSAPLICSYDVSVYDALMTPSTPFLTRTFKQVRQELGSTHNAVLVDLTQGISASVLAILSGTVRGNGIFAIALPNDDWLSLVDLDLPRYLPWPYKPEQIDSSFKRFFLSHLESPNSPFQSITRKTITALPALISVDENAPLTQEQSTVQASVLDQQAESYILIAPRGRGKSTLLGDSIAKLLKEGKRVAVTAPNQAAISTLKARFEHTAHSIDLGQNLPFFAPDALLADENRWDYLFVDEASMIPVPLLIALNQKAKHCVFSTTDYGYEGAGKGFGIRFCQYLKQLNPSLKELTLQQPIRWGGNDPLESWINDCFFLGAIGQVATTHNSAASNEYQHFVGKEWLSKTELLAQTFQLLVSAHYQTSSDNLRWILDDPSISTFLSLQGNALNSVAIITKEGDLPDTLCLDVMQGTRRPRGHLIPQSLLAHEGIADAGQYTYWRISRIATEQDQQNKGLASELIRHIEEVAKGQCDFLCTSFAATADVVAFWLKNGFIPVRLGTGKDQASGCYSLMMVKAMHAKASDLASLWHQYYCANLNLSRDYQDLSADLVEKLVQSTQTTSLTKEDLNQKDVLDLTLFTQHHRPYPTIRAQLTRLAQSVIANEKLTKAHPEYNFLNSIINQPHDQIDFTHFGLKTKKQVEKHLKKVVGELLL